MGWRDSCGSVHAGAAGPSDGLDGTLHGDKP